MSDVMSAAKPVVFLRVCLFVMTIDDVWRLGLFLVNFDIFAMNTIA